MADEIIKRDQNHVTILAGVTDDSNLNVTMLRIDPTTKRLLVSATGLPGSGTVTTVSVVSANGFAGTVANASSTPAITLTTTITGILQGNGTAISAITIGSGLNFAAGTLSATGSGGTVTTVSVVSANGFAGTVANATTTPAITLTTTVTAAVLKGNGTAIIASVAGTDYLAPNGSGAGLSGVVLSVIGTTDRITSSGGQNPVIDIAATYVGQTSITTLGTVTTGTWGATTIAVDKGGTGITSYAVGDIIYASGATTLSKLADVATGNALISGGVATAPLWGKIGLTTHVSGTLAVGNGGTGAATLTGVLHGNGASAFTAVALTTDGAILIGDGAGEPTTLAAFSSSTGTLKLANGGTAANLSDPGANRLWGWDDTDNSIGFWTIGTNLSYDHASHTLNSTGGGFIAQQIALKSGTDTIDPFFITSNSTGSVMYIGYVDSSSATTANIIRLAKDTITGTYYITHSTTLTVSANSIRGLAVAGSFLYVGAVIGGNSSIRRYAAADLSGVTTMTGVTAGTLDENMWSDGTDLFTNNGGDDYIRYTISGTAVTDTGAVTYASSASHSAISDGNFVWMNDGSIGSPTNNVRKYAITGGAASSTTTYTIPIAALPGAYGISMFMGTAAVLGFGWGFNNTSQSAVTGISANLFGLALP